MARATKDPDPLMAELHQKRVGIAAKRHELSAAQGAAERVLNGVADRRSAVVFAEARGAEPAETVEQVDLARREAEAEIVNARERAGALRQVEQEIGAEVDAVIDRYSEHFIAKGLAASEAATEAIASASQAAQAAVLAWQEARAAWAVVRLSRGRRRLELSPEVPISDLGSAVSELSQAQSRAWPGGGREAWERFCAYDSAPKVKVSNAEAMRAFEGGS